MTAPLSTDEATVLLTSILMDPQWSVDSIADLPKDDPFGKLCYNLAESVRTYKLCPRET